MEKERELAPSEYVFGSELSEDQLLSMMNIKVSDELAAEFEKATQKNGDVNLRSFNSLTQQGVVKMRLPSF